MVGGDAAGEDVLRADEEVEVGRVVLGGAGNLGGEGAMVRWRGEGCGG